MDNKFLGPVKFNKIKNLYEVDYFTLTDIDTTLQFKFSNGAVSYLLIPSNTISESIVSVSKFCVNLNLSNESIGLTVFDISSLRVELRSLNSIISNFQFKTPRIINGDEFYSKKIEYSEFCYSDWAQIIRYDLLPDKLIVLGVEVNNKLALYSIPGTITNYLMQLRYIPNSIINKNSLFELLLHNGQTLRLYSIEIEFSIFNLLYYTSILQYEIIINAEKDYFYNSGGRALNNFSIYSNVDAINEYLLLNLNKQIFRHYKLIDILNSNSYLNYSLTNDNVFELTSIEKYGPLLKRIFNPHLKLYESGINWNFNIITPFRYFVMPSGFYFDSYSGLAFDSNDNLTRNAPLFDWIDNELTDGVWTD